MRINEGARSEFRPQILTKGQTTNMLLLMVLASSSSLVASQSMHMHPVVPISYPCSAIFGDLQELPEAHCETQPLECLETQSSRYSAINGSCNNLKNPLWGAAGSNFIFMGPKNPVAADTTTMSFESLRTGNQLPNARSVSIAIHASEPQDSNNNKQATSIVLMQFGQILDHDLTLTPQSAVCQNTCGGGEGADLPDFCCDIFLYQNETLPNNCWPIPVTDGDPLFGEDGPKCLEFKKSQESQCLTDIDSDDAVQFNEVTHFIDASCVYGSSQAQSSDLRAGVKGLLRLNQFSDESLPFELNHCSNSTTRSLPLLHPRSFKAGDVRVNENPGLQTLHTLWALEHNRLAKMILNRYQTKTDDEVFEETRRYLIAEWQNTIYKEFLPLVIGKDQMANFGIDIGSEPTSYDPSLKPSVFVEFSTAAFRFGHSLISDMITLKSLEEGVTKTTEDETLSLVDNFFNTKVVLKKKMESLMMGMLFQPSENMDATISTAVREHLFQRHNATFGGDLASLNIQRGRDHSIASYGMVREMCNLSPLPDTFSGNTGKPDELPEDLWQRFLELYDSPLDIELFPAGLAERSTGDGILGPTFSCILGRQFRYLMAGDRFFFTHGNIDDSHKFCDSEIQAIQRRTLRDIICDNFGAKMKKVARNPFLVIDDNSNPLEDCDKVGTKLNPEDLCLFGGEEPVSIPVDETSADSRDVLLLAGGFDGASLVNSAELYSPDGNCNMEIATLPVSKYGLNVFTFNDNIFFCGGGASQMSSKCYQYLANNSTGEWQETDLMSLNFPRQMATITKSSKTGVIFVSGGLHTGNDSVEFLDRYTGQWMMGPLLSAPRSRHCFLVLQDVDLTVIGGFLSGTVLETYDDINNEWKTESKMMYNDRHSCVMLPDSENILIVGDRKRPSIYDQMTGIERQTQGSMLLNRGFGATVTLNGEIFVLGGEFHPTIVEKFDPKTETFSSGNVAELLQGRSRFGHTKVPSAWFKHLGCK